MNAYELADAGLKQLATVLNNPKKSNVSKLFADDVRIVTSGKAYRLQGIQNTMPAVQGLHEAQAEAKTDHIERRLVLAQFDEKGKLHTTHLVTWYQSDRIVAGPFSSNITWSMKPTGWQIESMQVSDQVPLSLQKPLSPFATGASDAKTLKPAEDAAEKICVALLNGNTDAFVKRIKLPFVLQWRNTVGIILNEEQARQHVRLLQTDLRRNGITHVFRAMASAYTLAENEIYANFVTYLLSGQNVLQSSYRNSMRMEQCKDKGWIATVLVDPRLDSNELEVPAH